MRCSFSRNSGSVDSFQVLLRRHPLTRWTNAARGRIHLPVGRRAGQDEHAVTPWLEAVTGQGVARPGPWQGWPQGIDDHVAGRMETIFRMRPVAEGRVPPPPTAMAVATARTKAAVTASRPRPARSTVPRARQARPPAHDGKCNRCFDQSSD